MNTKYDQFLTAVEATFQRFYSEVLTANGGDPYTVDVQQLQDDAYDYCYDQILA